MVLCLDSGFLPGVRTSEGRSGGGGEGEILDYCSYTDITATTLHIRVQNAVIHNLPLVINHS